MSKPEHRLPWREFGLAMGLIAFLAAISLPVIQYALSDRTPPCMQNLKHLAVAFIMYSSENKGLFPPMTVVQGEEPAEPGFVLPVPDFRSLHPNYLSDPAILFCPSKLENDGEFREILATDRWWSTDDGRADTYQHLSEYGYRYNGFEIWGYMTEQETAALEATIATATDPLKLCTRLPDNPVIKEREASQLEAVVNQLIVLAEGKHWRAAHKLVNEDIHPSSTEALGVQAGELSRLRYLLERGPITASCFRYAQSEIWVLHDPVFTDASQYWHTVAGANVLYLDGHVTYQEWGDGSDGMSPVNRAMAAVYERLKPFGPPRAGI